MDSLTAKTTAIGALVLAIVNVLASFGLVLPAFLTAPAVALINAAALGVVGAVAGIKHLMEKPSAAA